VIEAGSGDIAEPGALVRVAQNLANAFGAMTLVGVMDELERGANGSAVGSAKPIGQDDGVFTTLCEGNDRAQAESVRLALVPIDDGVDASGGARWQDVGMIDDAVEVEIALGSIGALRNARSFLERLEEKGVFIPVRIIRPILCAVHQREREIPLADVE